MIFVFYILAALLIFMSYRSFRGGVEYLRYFKQELSSPTGFFTPFATVITPIKGLDDGLAENLDVFFFKQKTAYEIWRCDWSSDVAVLPSPS